MATPRANPLSARGALLSTEIWVQRLNALAAKIAEYEAVLHHSAWREQLADLHAEYAALARRPTHDPEDDPQQIPLF